MARIISSEKTANGVGYQYNIQGVDGVSAIITEYGPSIGAQGKVESLLFAASLADGVFQEGKTSPDFAFADILAALNSERFGVEIRGVYFDYEDTPELFLCEKNAVGKIIRDQKIS